MLLDEETPPELIEFASSMGGIASGDRPLPWVPFITTTDAECEEAIGGLRRNIYDGEDGPKLLFGLTLSSSFEARSRIVDQYCMALMSIAVPIHFRQLARSVIANGAALIDPKRERQNYKFEPISSIITDQSFFEPSIDWNDEYIIKNISRIATEIVLNHEFAHICNGHIGWLHQELGFNEIDELDVPCDGVPLEFYQALEWSADAYAAHRTLVRALSLPLRECGANEDGRFNPPPYGRCGTWEMALYTIGVALCLVVRSFSSHRSNRSDEKRKYPPNWYRMQQLILSFDKAIEDHFIDASGESIRKIILNHLIDGIASADKAWARFDDSQLLFNELFTREKIDDGARITDIYTQVWSQIGHKVTENRLILSYWDAI